MLNDPYQLAPCGLLVTDEVGVITSVNATACQWLERPAAQLVGRRFQDLLAVGSKIYQQTHWLPLLHMQGAVSEVQLELTLPEGEALPVLVNAVRDAGSRQVTIALFVTHDRRKYEQELLHARRRAEEALDNERRAQRALAAETRAREQLADQLIGIVSHDLRTPLNAIVLSARVLGREATSALQARMVDHIDAAASRAMRLIADLLDFTQARVGGGLRVDREPVDLHLVVGACVDELRMAWPGRTITHLAVGSGQGYGDADRMAQVVTNLATNALSYGTPDDPVMIESRSDEHALTLRVHNWGPPIPEALRPVIFEPLRRGEQHEPGSRSVGLGLFIVQQIALAHGGEVTLSSSAGEGTSFTVTFPTAQAGSARS